MHDTAMTIGQRFFELYGAAGRRFIVDIGSQDVNGTLRDHASPEDVYIGVDVAHGKGVDLVTLPDAPLPFRDGIADFVLSSSQLEHDPFFWNTFLEFARITKPGGHIYVNAPSNGSFHRYSRDIWRFYPDAGKALESWARKNGRALSLVECFTAARKADQWNDFVAVFRNGTPDERQRLISDEVDCFNVTTFRNEDVVKLEPRSEDMRIIARLRALVTELEGELAKAKAAVPTAGIAPDAQ